MSQQDERIAALLFERHKDGTRRFSDESLASLQVYLGALDGSVAGASLVSTPPPPIVLVDALLALAHELRIDLQSAKLARALSQMGSPATQVPKDRKPISNTSALFARFNTNR